MKPYSVSHRYWIKRTRTWSSMRYTCREESFSRTWATISLPLRTSISPSFLRLLPCPISTEAFLSTGRRITSTLRMTSEMLLPCQRENWMEGFKMDLGYVLMQLETTKKLSASLTKPLRSKTLPMSTFSFTELSLTSASKTIKMQSKIWRKVSKSQGRKTTHRSCTNLALSTSHMRSTEDALRSWRKPSKLIPTSLTRLTSTTTSA